MASMSVRMEAPVVLKPEQDSKKHPPPMESRRKAKRALRADDGAERPADRHYKKAIPDFHIFPRRLGCIV